ncbi:MAG: tripartite tricarboxylate transporter substrate binding protein [Synergistaceae bacterium]|jgi:tripartite-type tricarboxylate transporter receptor subunit TctC|nr:tripartite tricarboxylate transporter substrate binding protein [Synergistaceae bacterium]
MRKLLLAAVVCACVLGAGAAWAAYPEQPITLICPWQAGGGTDAVARIVATLMQKELGVPVNVVNRTGGNGVIGHQAIISAKPDGYTIGIGSAELAMLHWMGLTDFTAKDFNPVAGVNLDLAAITVRTDGPWADYKALEAAIKANPGKLTASGTAAGGCWHLALAMWLTAAGFKADDVRWIPSEGAAPAQQELMSGGIDMVTVSVPEVAALVDAGKTKILAYMSEVRSTKYPEVPTLKELGIPVSTGTWRGIFAPMGVPGDIMKLLEATVSKVVKEKDFIDFMNSRGLGINYLPSKEFGALVVKSDEEFGVAMKAAGLTK